ncbi:MAG: aspartate kinase [Chloroflexota bacterium]
MSKTLVMKFGGTSVGSPAAIRQVIEIVRRAKADWDNVALVVSAVSGVTDTLLNGANGSIRDPEAASVSAEILRRKHFAILDELAPAADEVRAHIEKSVAEFESLCQAIHILGEASPRALDAISSLGERVNAPLVAAALSATGVASVPVDTRQVIVTDEAYLSASPFWDETTARSAEVIQPVFASGAVPVLTGFIGANRQGVTTTLGRGGSDFSAAIFGVTLAADEVWIWTDVTGVMTADPRLVPEARTLAEISYSEIAELAYYGAKVLHPKTVRPVVEAGIGLRICNTFNPSHPGTRLVPSAAGKVNGKQVIKAVTAIRRQRLITVEGRGMLGVPGVAARAFGAVASTGTSVPLITQASSEQSICFAVPTESAQAVVESLEKVFAAEIRQDDIDRVWATEDVSIITVVGAGMRHTPGVAGQIFSQLGRREVNVLAIAQGSSEVSISMVVEAAATEAAVKALHELLK